MESNPNQEYHEMVFLGATDDGDQELYCPICGRRLLVQWPPNYQKIVLEPGDVNAIHSGGTGGLSVHVPRATAAQAKGIPAEDQGIEQDESILAGKLDPFIDWMDQVGFDSFWD